MNKYPRVALVGRMNVGKSTLFNRLSTSVRSMTLDYEGVTRDVLKDFVVWRDRTFELVDTGGIHMRKSQDPIFEKVRQKAINMVEESDVIVFVIDGSVGVTHEDREIAKFLRKLDKKVIVAYNKIDTAAAQEHAYQAEQLGFSERVSLSSGHGTGINELLDAVVHILPAGGALTTVETDLKVIFLGRPNVGKSSLMNALLKHERSIVSDIPGTTREAISERITFYQEHIQITDTPGIRRKRAISGELEPLMVKSALHALKNADIVVMLIDVTQADLVDQELKLAFYAFKEQHKGLILLLNKVDLMTEQMKADLDRALDFYSHLIKKIPVLSISCLSGKNVGKVLSLIHEVGERYKQQLPDEEINRLFISTLQRKPLMHNKKPLHVHEVWQQSKAPLTIVLRVNEPTWFGESQLGFFENLLRKEYNLLGTPVRFITKK